MQKNKNDNSKNNSENKKDELEEFLDKIPDESFDDIRNVDYHEDFDSFKEVKLHTGLSGLKYLFTASGIILIMSILFHYYHFIIVISP